LTTKQQTEKGKQKMEKVEISKTTAKTIIFFMTDYLYYTDSLDKETRANIAALDELITALDYEDEYRAKVEEIQNANIKMNAEYAARRAEAGNE
jgi:flagellar biosynthesis regulator FlaF